MNGGPAGNDFLVTQLATAAGVKVILLRSKCNANLGKAAGAFESIAYQGQALADEVIEIVSSASGDLVRIFDAVATEVTFSHDLSTLAEPGGWHLACTHPLLAEVPEDVKADMIWARDDAPTPAPGVSAQELVVKL
ncbi:MAG: hypothetical protein GOMPHAMPRED_003269 [Gomphillus americanus]|uniref:Uncharacterized protein n=1 Tax=Gomphillus americanus TaxID=1940652 RepID=A0A8H3EJC1_9LECA|nr:MAG: hypothetical protein GOMPHAMPRED_003269 [Gomphillus americanus]